VYRRQCCQNTSKKAPQVHLNLIIDKIWFTYP